MSSSQIQPSDRGAHLSKLTAQQRMFVHHLMASESFCPKDAAKAAGYKNPSQSAYQLLKNQTVFRYLGKQMLERQEELKFSAVEVLRMLQTILFFNPLKLFKPTKDGKWAIQDLNTIPDEIGRLITKMKVKEVEMPDGSKATYFEIEFMDKNQALSLAMDHMGLKGKTRIEHSVDKEDTDLLSKLLDSIENPSSQIIDAEFIKKEAS